jgi:hypothetical protein
MRRPILAALLALLSAAGLAGEGRRIALAGSVVGSLGAWSDRGSAFVPAGTLPPWSGAVKGEARAETEGRSRCAMEGGIDLDPSTGAIGFRLSELWAEWGAADWASLRLGRQRLGFGSGFAWNPSDDLDPRRDPTDPTASRTGIDALQLRLDAGSAAGFPLSLSAVAVLPPGDPGAELADSRLGVQAYAYIGAVELMLVGSLGELSSPGSAWLAGGWATAPLGPFVLGLEGALRRRADAFRPDAAGSPVASDEAFAALVATATFRKGDWAVVGELGWDEAAYGRDELAAMLASPSKADWAALLASPGSVGPLHALVRVSWAPGDLAASCGAIVDPLAPAFLAMAELAWSADDDSVLRLQASMPGPRPEAPRDELDLSGRGLAALVSVAVYF